MQRVGSSVYRSPDEHCVINIDQMAPQGSISSPKGKKDDSNGGFASPDLLPVCCGRRNRRSSRTVPPKKWIHAIPVLVILCIFILWLASHPVTVVKENDKITIYPLDVPPQHLNDTAFDVTILASMIPPVDAGPATSQVQAQRNGIASSA